MSLARACPVIAVALFAALAARVGPASACSCAPIDDPRRVLLESDGAFVGRLVSRRPVPDNPQQSIFRFRVDQRVKGALGETVEVRSSSSGAACGLEVVSGRPIGLFLEREGGVWTSSLCRQIDPAALRTAALPLPRPNGKGAIGLLVGGTFGPYRTLALDRAGRTLAYGRGRGVTRSIAVCPGSRRAVEIVDDWPDARLAVRDLRTFRVVREVPLPPSSQWATGVACRDRTASDALVLVVNPDVGSGTRLLRVRRGVAVIWRGRAAAGAVARSGAYLCTASRGTRLLSVGLNGRTRTVARVPANPSALATSPDGRFVAGVSHADTGRAVPSRVFLAGSRSTRVRVVSVAELGYGGYPAWFDRRRFVVFPRNLLAHLRVYDTSLRLRGRAGPMRADVGALARGTAFGVETRPARVPTARLVAARMPRGRSRTIRKLPSAAVSTLVAVRGRVVVGSPPTFAAPFRES